MRVVEKKRHESKSFVARNESYLFLDAPWLIARNRIESDRYCGPLYKAANDHELSTSMLPEGDTRAKGETPRETPTN